jgi:hypothetical protein
MEAGVMTDLLKEQPGERCARQAQREESALPVFSRTKRIGERVERPRFL